MPIHAFVLITFLASASLLAQSRSERDYWRETQLNFDVALNGEITDQNCYRHERLFRGCLFGLHAGLTVLPTYRSSGILPGERGVLPGFVGVASQGLAYREQAIAAWRATTPPQRRAAFDAALAALKRAHIAESLSWSAARSLNGFLSIAVDPHTSISPLAVREERARPSQVQGLYGLNFVGVTIDGQEALAINAIDPASPSHGLLRIGDVIRKVEGRAGEPQELFEALITRQAARVEVENIDGLREVDMRRGPITSSNVEAKSLTHAGLTVAHVSMGTFLPANTCEDTVNKIAAQLNAGARALVLDLRANGGGRTEQAICLISQFLENGSYVWRDFGVRSGRGDQVRRNPRGRRLFQDVPTVVLIDGNSASASEQTSIYLQAYRKAIVVGETSFGKGTMQEVGPYPRNNQVSMSLTVAMFYGPNGVSPQLIGVTPDFEVFPTVGQSEPTPVLREGDLFPDAISNDVTPPRDQVREARNQRLQECLERTDGVAAVMEGLNAYEARVHDLQLATARALLKCHQDERMEWPRDINIPSVPMPGPMRDR